MTGSGLIRVFTIGACLLSLCIATSALADTEPHRYGGKSTHDIKIGRHASHADYRMDHVDLRFDDGSLIFHDQLGDEEVEITSDNELYINGDHIETTPKQKEILAEYHDAVSEIVDQAMVIGYEGVKVGAHGAALGLKAVGRVFKMLSPEYDSDDLERDMERDAAKIEKRAEELEKKAEKIEKKADRLEVLSDKLCDEIPELEKLRWF